MTIRQSLTVCFVTGFIVAVFIFAVSVVLINAVL